MGPFAYYQAIYTGKKFKQETEFLKHYRLAKQFASHFCGGKSIADDADDAIRDVLCQASELIMPLLENPFVQEEKFENYMVKIDRTDIYEKLYSLFCIGFPEEMLYRGVN